MIHQPFLVPALGLLFGKMDWPIPVILMLSTAIGIAVPVIVSHYIIEKFEILKFLVLEEGYIEK